MESRHDYSHRSVIVSPHSESARGLAHSRTLARPPHAPDEREASWSGAAPCRFGSGKVICIRHEIVLQPGLAVFEEYPVFVTFAGTHENLAPGNIDILYPQAQGFGRGGDDNAAACAV